MPRPPRKRQTRLSFTPLPSSSPRAAAVKKDTFSMPQQKRRMMAHQSEAVNKGEASKESFESPVKGANIAVVIYTPSKSRKHHEAVLDALPTPQHSSQFDAADQGPPLAASANGVTATSDTDNDIQILPSPASTQTRKPKRSPNRPKIVKPTPSKQKPRSLRSHLPRQTLSGAGISGAGQVNDLSRVPAGAHLETTLRSPTKANGLGSSAMSVDEGTSRQGVIDISSDNVSDSELSILASPPRSSQKIFTGNLITPKQDRKKKQDEGSSRRFLLGGNTGNAPVSNSKARSPPRQNKLASTRTPTMAQDKAKASVKDNHTAMDEDDSDEIATSPVKRRKRQEGGHRSVFHTVISNEDEAQSDNEEELFITPSRKRTVAKSSTATSRLKVRSRERPLASTQDQDEEDLEEDLEILQDTNLEARRTRTRIASAKKGKAQRQLEILKRRRAGEKINNKSSSSDDEQVPKRGIYDSDSDDLSSPDGNDDSDAVEEDVSGIEAIRETLRSDRRDEYDDDFVDDEEEGTIGAPLGLEDIPIEFTRHAHKGMIEHFKDAVEWMVHNKLNPAFPRDDPLYRTAFRRLDDIVKGYTASKFVSAAWNPKFVRALQSRPIFYDRELPIAEGDKCDACNRSGHPAKFQVQFGGKSYHRENLEDVSDASEDESDEDDAKSHDSQGRSIPDSETLYFVGRFCKANAETAHSLIHWRYHLNQWVIDHLKEENHFSPEKVVEREGWPVKRRQKYANNVVDTMEEAGEIRSLFRDFETNLDTARDSKPSRYREK